MANEPLYWRVWVIIETMTVVLDDSHEPPPIAGDMRARVYTFSDFTKAEVYACEIRDRLVYDLVTNTIPF